MLQSKTKWHYLETYTETTHPFDEQADYSKIMSELLLQRGINTLEEAETFLTPELSDLYDPDKLSSMDKATKRIHKAIAEEESILIFGDYDADGITSTSLLLTALRELGAKCDFYIPNRFTEGYGLSVSAFESFSEQGFGLVITVDTGIASHEEAKVAQSLGLDLIITDHHELQGDIPEAFAVLNPKKTPDYPFQELAGVGVAFKLAESLLGYFPKHLLGYVALGTIADLVPLVSENRILTYHGLKELSDTDNVGIKALKKIAGIEGVVEADDVGFSIGPRLNAVGRLQDASLAVDLLMTDDPFEAEAIAEEIEAINEERKTIVQSILDEAVEMIGPNPSRGITVVAKEGWNEGVLGIVASHLVRIYDQPAIVLAIKPELKIMKGSARSIPTFDLFEAGMKIRHLFTQFGGHAQAAGMTLLEDNIDEIKSSLNEFINDQLTSDEFTQITNISKTVNVTEVNEELIHEVSKLAPFGMGNPKPLFELKAIPSDARQLGKLKNHLKLFFKDGEHLLEGIGFNIGEHYHFITPHTAISLVGEIGINEWNGIRKPQIIIRDLKITDWQLFDHRGRMNTDISPYIKSDQRVLIVGTQERTFEDYPEQEVIQLNYQDNFDQLTNVDSLFLYDLPPSLEQLESIIYQTNPDNIHACFYVENSAYLTAFPSRDEFIWFYSLVAKHKSVDFKVSLKYIMQMKKWSEEHTRFIADVFNDLGFVHIKDEVVHYVDNPEKKELNESNLYQERIKQGNIEKVLYFTNYETLRKWFADRRSDAISTKEEY